MYEAVSLNHAEVTKALVQLERAINRSVRDNDSSSVAALTKTQMLLVSVRAEARFLKILYLPGALTVRERGSILSEETAVNRWLRTIEVAFRKHYRVKAGQSLEDRLDHDTLAKRDTLLDLIDKHLNLVISLRNKLAHGQWMYPLNADLTAVEGGSLAAMKHENTLSLKHRDNLIHVLGSIVTDLVQKGSAFEPLFANHFRKLRENRKLLEEADYEAWCGQLRATKAILARADRREQIDS